MSPGILLVSTTAVAIYNVESESAAGAADRRPPLNIHRERIEKELAEFIVGEIFERDSTQTADQFEGFASGPDKITGCFGNRVLSIHAKTNGAAERNFKPGIVGPK